MVARTKASDGELAALGAWLRESYGLRLLPEKKAELSRAWDKVGGGERLGKVVAAPAANAEILQRLLNALTVGETYFFRIQPHFDALRNVILPDIVGRRGDTKRVRLWSAGCATGEEPYSLAMVILEVLPRGEGWDVEILATDVNTDFLASARDGFYRAWSFRKVDDYWRRTYFRTEGDGFRLVPEVKRLVRFERANLMSEEECARATRREVFDLILCRNVTIYFDDNALARATGGVTERLAPGGWYLVGHAEPLFPREGFELVNFPGAVAYRRLTEAPPAAGRPARAPRREPPKPAARPEGRAPSRPARAKTAAAASPVVDVAAVDAFIARGDDAQALAACERLAATRLDAGVAWRLGRVLGNLGRYDEALVWCRRAAELDHASPYPYYIAALVYEELGDNRQAFEYLRRSLFVDKGFVLGHFSMANYHRWRRDEERAERFYRNVLELLASRADDDEVSGDGLTAGRLRQIVAQIL
jgi:chemotaxis protein methyltransferase CheR